MRELGVGTVGWNVTGTGIRGFEKDVRWDLKDASQEKLERLFHWPEELGIHRMYSRFVKDHDAKGLTLTIFHLTALTVLSRVWEHCRHCCYCGSVCRNFRRYFSTKSMPDNQWHVPIEPHRKPYFIHFSFWRHRKATQIPILHWTWSTYLLKGHKSQHNALQSGTEKTEEMVWK